MTQLRDNFPQKQHITAQILKQGLNYLFDKISTWKVIALFLVDNAGPIHKFEISYVPR
jgi:hypothetical protein